MSKEGDETEPLWLSKEHDHMLFGSGKIPSGDEEAPPPPQDYGSISSNNNKPSATADDGNDDFASAKSSRSSKSNRSKSKQQLLQNKKKKQKNAPQPPPKSIFDDSEHWEDDQKAPDDDSSVTDTHALETKPHMPSPNYCLYFFRVVACVAVVGSLGLIATQIIPLVIAPHTQGVLDFCLKVYVSLFCILFLLVEFDAPIPFLRNSQLLQMYLSRGFLYSFLGLICVSEAYSERVKEIVQSHADEFHVAWASLFMQISSWLMLGCGLFYMLMGLCCLKRLRDKLSKKDRQAWARYRKDFKEWKRLNPK